MERDRVEHWWLLVPPSVRHLPADLAAVLGTVLAVNLAVFVPLINQTPLRIVLGLPFVLFVPGYAFIAALFPEAGESPTEELDTGGDDEERDTERTAETDATADTSGVVGDRGIDGIERVALSFGLSIAIVPLIGLVLNFTPWGIRLVPIMVATSGFTIAATAVATRRRRELPPDDRFRVPYRTWVEAGRTELFEPDSRADAALNVLLVLSILLAVSSVAYAVAVPKQGETFTEFYLLTEDDDDELVAANYPTEFVAGEGRELVVGIGNQEHEATNYTVVVELQRVEFETADGESVSPAANSTANVTRVRVTETQELERVQTRLSHNETWDRPFTVRPTMAGANMRLTFLLYRDAPPQNPSVDTAYRETHLWVNVTAA